MRFNKILGISEQPPRADKSAVGTINRPLRIISLKCIIAPLLFPFIKWQRNDLSRHTLSTNIDVYNLSDIGMRCYNIAHTDIFM